MIYLKSHCQCTLLRCTVEHIALGAWTCKTSHLLICNFNYKKLWKPVIGNNVQCLCPHCGSKCHPVRKSRPLDRSMFIVYAIRNEQGYNPSEPDVKRRSFLCKTHTCIVFFQVVLAQVRSWRVVRITFHIDAFFYCFKNVVYHRIPIARFFSARTASPPETVD